MKILSTTLALAGLVLAGFVLTAATRPSAPAPVAPAAAATAYTVDPVHSSTVFSTTHMGVSRFYGRFDKIAGTITMDSAKPENSTISIEIDIASIDTNNKGRDEHLRGPDFFDVKQFPSATFDSRSVKKAGDKSYQVVGDLTLHGVTKTITIPMEATGTGKGREGEALIGFHGTFTIQRSDFGMTYGVQGAALGDEVSLIVSVEAAAAK